MSRKPLRLMLMIAAAMGLLVWAILWFTRPKPGTVHTLMIHAVDAQIRKPVPLLITGPNYAGADPWQRQWTRISRDTIQIQWVERSTPGKNWIYSPGYHPLPLELGGRKWRSETTYVLWRDPRPPPAAMTPATQRSIASPGTGE